MSLHSKTIKAFSLVELLIVIAIIGVLTTIVLTAMGNARDRATETAVKAEISEALKQAEVFSVENGGFYKNSTTDACTDPINGVVTIIESIEKRIGAGTVQCVAGLIGFALSATISEDNAICSSTANDSFAVFGNVTAGIQETNGLRELLVLNMQ